MRSATSYFNPTLYRKTLARFWPLWAGYGVIWLFLMPLNLLNQYLNATSNIRYQIMEGGIGIWRLEQALQFPSYVTPGLYLSGFFAILCAMAVFGYLYNSRSACWTHALPMRREALFTTQYLAGLSFLLLPQLVTALFTAMVELAFLPAAHWGKALAALLAWLIALSGIALFFFSFAAFCAMFTGHILALPAFYGILNVLASVIYELLDNLFREFFFGYGGDSNVLQIIEYLTPAAALREASMSWGVEGERYFQSSATIAVYAAVGVVLAVASLYVYRRRHVETAGDVVAIPLVRPLFKYGVSFCAGLCFGMFTAAFFGWDSVSSLIPCVLVWSVIGYFVAEMLLRKSFRVLKAWKGAAMMAGIMLVLCLACSMDLLGVAARVPRVDQVERMDITLELGYPRDSGDILHTTLTSPEDIQKFMALHQAIVDDRDRLDFESSRFYSGNDYTSFQVWYTLKGGSEFHRYYTSLPLYREEMDMEGSVTNLMWQLFQDRTLVKEAYGFDEFLNGRRLTGAWLYNLVNANLKETYDDYYVDDYAKELWDAVRQDFDEGTLGVRYPFETDEGHRTNTYVTDLTFSSEDLYSSESYTSTDGSIEYAPHRSFTLTITLTPQARHTLAVLEQTGIFEEGCSLTTLNEQRGLG